MSSRKQKKKKIIAKPGEIYLFTNPDGLRTYWMVTSPTNMQYSLTPAIRINTEAAYTEQELEMFPPNADILIDGDEWTRVA